MVKCHFGGQIGLNKGFKIVTAITLSTALVASFADAGTSQKKSSGSYSGPETGLLGVKLYDSGLRVISLYGNPDSISTVNAGTTSSAPGGGGPPGGFGGSGSRGGGGGGGGRPTPGVPGAGASSGADKSTFPNGLIPGTFGDPIPDMQSGGSPQLAPPGPGGGSQGGGRGPVGPSGPGGSPGVPGRGGAGGAGGGSASESTLFTRWSYTRNGCKLAFVIDKFDRVIQIEAIGLQNARIKTRRGVGFGSTFSQVMKAYASTIEPDGYDISGNNFTIRFLTRQRVAFRLSQLSNKKAHVVTGIVVAAGKQ